MSNQTNISTSTHLPFEELVALLQQEGFSVKPDDYIELLKVVERFSGDGLNALKFRLAPLIVTSEEEQAKFYKVFDEYEKLTREKDQAQETAMLDREIAHRKKKKWLIAGAIGIILILSVALWYVQTSNTNKLQASFTMLINSERPSGNFAIPGDTINLDASGSFIANGKPVKDSVAIQLSWNIGKGWQESKNKSISFLANSIGTLPVYLRVKKNDETSIDTQYLHVCEGVLTGIQADEQAQPFRPKDVVKLEASVRGDKHILDNHQWMVNGAALSQKGERIQYPFDSAGSYTIALQAGADGSSCGQTQQLVFDLEKPSQQYALTVANAGTAIPLSYKLNPLLWLLLLLPLSWLLLTYYRQRKKMQQDKEANAKKQAQTREKVSDKTAPPHEVPFENRELLLVDKEPGMNTLFRAMRSKTEDESQSLNIRKSIRAEILSGGIPSLVFSNRVKHQEFVILIDHANPKNQQVKLFEYLARIFGEENISIERFYYRNFDAFYNENFPTGLSLSRLTELYRSHVLLIFGNAHQLIYPAYPVVEAEKAGWLNEWEYKAILTPVSYKDWSTKEEALKKQFILLPADIEGQAILMQAIKEKQLKHDRYLSSFGKFVETSEYYLTDVADIKEYLDDEVLFQWLCATAVYPKIRWEILIETGKAVCAKYQQPGKVNFSNLLKLVRIPWMQEGIFPETTRLSLLKELGVGNEVVARETVLEMLKYPALYFPGDHFFEEEKALQEVTSQFVLYAHDNKKYQEHVQAFHDFKLRWEEERIPDGPLKAYLEKNGQGQWQTPLQKNGKHVSIKELLATTDPVEAKDGSINFTRQYIAAATILCLLLGVFFFGRALLQNVSSSNLPLVYLDSVQNRNISFTLRLDSCTIDKPAFFTGLSGTITAGNSDYPLQISTAGLATATIPGNVWQVPNTMVRLAWNNDQSTAGVAFNLADDAVLSLHTCTAAALSPLYVRYNNAEMYNSDRVQQLVNILKTYYDVKDARPDSFDVSRIIYYEQKDKNRADSITSFTSSSIGQQLKVEYIPERRDPPAVPILYLAFKDTLSVNAWTPIAFPAMLQDIWKGVGNNRLININPTANVVYYSTGEKKTYGTYRIVSAMSGADNSIKILLKADQGYRVAFAKNISASNFELALCPNWYKTESETLVVEPASCGEIDRMVPYFEKSATLLYLPIIKQNGNSYFPASERLKLMNLSQADDPYANNPVQQNAVIVSNQQFVQRLSAATMNSFLSRNKVKYNVQAGDITVLSSPDPFQRNYIRLNQTSSPGANSNDDKETDLGSIYLDPKGYPLQEGQQLIQTVSQRMRNNPRARIRLEGEYSNDYEQKQAASFINTILSLFSKEGVNTKIKVTQRLNKVRGLQQNQQQNAPAQSGNWIRVIGIGFEEDAKSAYWRKARKKV